MQKKAHSSIGLKAFGSQQAVKQKLGPLDAETLITIRWLAVACVYHMCDNVGVEKTEQMGDWDASWLNRAAEGLNLDHM